MVSPIEARKKVVEVRKRGLQLRGIKGDWGKIFSVGSS